MTTCYKKGKGNSIVTGCKGPAACDVWALEEEGTPVTFPDGHAALAERDLSNHLFAFALVRRKTSLGGGNEEYVAQR